MSTMDNPYAPPKAAVRDIFAADEPFIYADRGTRLGAAIVDTIIFMVMVYIPLVVPSLIAGAPTPESLESGAGFSPIILAGFAFGMVGLIVWASLTIMYVVRNGQTIGKKWLKIKVVRSDGSPASLGRIFWLRNFVNGLLGIIPLYGMIEVLFIFGESRQCLHDKLADTIVIKD
jgi:uncharacterized RDD family membrane protein YckC